MTVFAGVRLEYAFSKKAAVIPYVYAEQHVACAIADETRSPIGSDEKRQG